MQIRAVFRNTDGSMTAAAIAGEDVFQENNCASCHGGDNFTDSASSGLHDIGTLKPSSGNWHNFTDRSISQFDLTVMIASELPDTNILGEFSVVTVETLSAERTGGRFTQ